MRRPWIVGGLGLVGALLTGGGLALLSPPAALLTLGGLCLVGAALVYFLSVRGSPGASRSPSASELPAESRADAPGQESYTASGSTGPYSARGSADFAAAAGAAPAEAITRGRASYGNEREEAAPGTAAPAGPAWEVAGVAATGSVPPESTPLGAATPGAATLGAATPGAAALGAAASETAAPGTVASETAAPAPAASAAAASGTAAPEAAAPDAATPTATTSDGEAARSAEVPAASRTRTAPRMKPVTATASSYQDGGITARHQLRLRIGGRRRS